MITKAFLKLTDYPIGRRIVWKPIYELLSRKFKIRDWSFMNYGYAPTAAEPVLSLALHDEINRYPIQLYHYLCCKVEICGLVVLEIGSGRGGGVDYICRYFRPKKIVGLDIAFNAVQLANKHYQNEAIRFVQGSAEELPFADDSFDVVINVESSHAYGSVPAFLAEVKRVLRKDGHLLITDIRTASAMPVLYQQLQVSGLEIISEEDISESVSKGIELEEPIKQKRIIENVPSWLQKVFCEFAGTTGSMAHMQLKSGALVYKRYLLKKR